MSDMGPGPCDVCGEDLEAHTRPQLDSCMHESNPAVVPISEPPIGTVVSFKINHNGRVYDYAALRAGNGLWYTTGGRTAQGVNWATFSSAIEDNIVGPFVIMRPDRTYYF